MRFDWWTLLLQIVNFSILVWLLWRFLYKPVQAVIAKRRELAEAALSDAAAKRAEAEAEKQRLERERAELEKSRQALIDAARNEGEEKRRAIIANAQRQADALLAEARNKAAEAREADIASLKGELAQTAAAMARAILSRTADESLDAVFRAKMLRKLDARMREQGAPKIDLSQGPVRLTTAAPLAEAERRAWKEALEERAAASVDLAFAVDPDLVAGAELSLPNGSLRFAWSDELAEADRLLVESKAAE